MLLLLLASCQIVADIQSQHLDPPPPDGVCNFPSYITNTGPQVRLANLVPTSDSVDICIRASGSASWGRPLLFNGGTTCPQGFGYAQVSDKFSAPAATVDVKLVASGNSCSDPALTEGDGLSLATDSVTTLARIGGNGVDQTIVALPEANKQNTQGIWLRPVHAMPGVGPLDFGVTAGNVTHLPASIATPLLSGPVPFGTAPTQGQKANGIGTVDSRGYDELMFVAYNLVAQVHGQSKGLLLQNLSKQGTFTLYAIGVSGDNLHPLRGLLCDDGAPAQGGLESCAASPLPTISVDVWNPALYGENSPFNDEREPQIPSIIAGRDTDIMCLAEVDSATDQAAITTAVAGSKTPYPYVYAGPMMNLSTPFSDPHDQNGNVPPAPTVPPCGGSVSSADVNAAFSCLEQNCSNKPGDPGGQLNQSTDCIATNCPGQILTVKSDSTACYDCIIDYVATGATTYAQAQQLCTTDTRPPLGYQGLNNSMIVSRYPLMNTAAFVLPSTFFRRSVLYAQVQLEDQTTVDFYCGFLISTLIYSDVPYVGSYGGAGCDITQTGTNSDMSNTCWQGEQQWQAKQLVNWVQKNSAGRPAIVVGEWRSSTEVDAPGSEAGTAVMVASLNPATMAILNGGTKFTPVNPPGWTPQCIYCPNVTNPNDPAALSNPYNSAQTNFFVSQPYLVNWPGNNPATAAVDMSLIYTDPMAFTNLPGGMPSAGPASPYYGVNMHVLRPNANGGM